MKVWNEAQDEGNKKKCEEKTHECHQFEHRPKNKITNDVFK